MTGAVQSADGTPIAYERSGSGPPLVIVGGAFNDAASAQPLAWLLAGHFTVYRYDRRGRGASGDTPPYAPDREIEDLAAVIDAAGSPVRLFGHSSGAVLALETAAVLGPERVARLALYEPPYAGGRDEPDGRPDLGDRVSALVAAGRRGEAVEAFMRGGPGASDESMAAMRAAPWWGGLEALAHTVPNDIAIVGAFPPSRGALVSVPTLVMDGGLSPEWAQQAVALVVAAVPGAQSKRFEDQDHGVEPTVLAPVLKRFFS
jgi:pimeloyl-ACP methyl ester carboxylesterase